MVDVGPRDNVADVDESVIGEVRIDGDAINPRSQVLSTFTVANGRGKSVPHLTTRSAPVCSQTRIRPSGVTANAVAPVIPAAIRSLEKPGCRIWVP